MIRSCPSCHRVIVKENRNRTKGGSLVVLSGSKLELDSVGVLRVHCVCGKVIVLNHGK